MSHRFRMSESDICIRSSLRLQYRSGLHVKLQIQIYLCLLVFIHKYLFNLGMNIPGDPMSCRFRISESDIYMRNSLRLQYRSGLHVKLQIQIYCCIPVFIQMYLFNQGMNIQGDPMSCSFRKSESDICIRNSLWLQYRSGLHVKL